MIDRCGVRIPHRRVGPFGPSFVAKSIQVVEISSELSEILRSCPIVWRGSAQVGLVWMKWVRGHGEKRAELNVWWTCGLWRVSACRVLSAPHRSPRGMAAWMPRTDASSGGIQECLKKATSIKISTERP